MKTLRIIGCATLLLGALTMSTSASAHHWHHGPYWGHGPHWGWGHGHYWGGGWHPYGHGSCWRPGYGGGWVWVCG